MMATKGTGLGPGKAFLTAYVDKSVVQRLDALASAQDVSRSKLVEQLVLQSLEEREMEVKLLTDPIVAPALMQSMARPEVMRAMMQAMKSELGDEQLRLFEQTMRATAEQVEKRVRRVNAQRSPRRGGAAPGKRRKAR